MLTSWDWDWDRFFWGRERGPAARPPAAAPIRQRLVVSGAAGRARWQNRPAAPAGVFWGRCPPRGFVGSLSAPGVRRPRPKPGFGAVGVWLCPVLPPAPAPTLGPEAAADGATRPKRRFSAIGELVFLFFFCWASPTGSPPRPPLSPRVFLLAPGPKLCFPPHPPTPRPQQALLRPLPARGTHGSLWGRGVGAAKTPPRCPGTPQE